MVHVDVKEQREYPRMVLSLPVLVEVQGKAGGVMYRIFNLSEGGVFIPTDSPLPVPSEVTLFFILDSGTSEVNACGSVVRSVPASDGNGEPAGMAIEFTEFGPLGWKFLRRILQVDDARPDF